MWVDSYSPLVTRVNIKPEQELVIWTRKHWVNWNENMNKYEQ